MIEFHAPGFPDDLTLPEVESAHCCRVLRMKAGDRIRVVDGRGGAYECEITVAKPKATEVKILETHTEPLHWQPRITLVVAPTKNADRIEWLVEKAVEIGVNEIIFIECQRGIRKSVKHERIHKILVSAMKQSLKATLPSLKDSVPLEMFLACTGDGFKYVGYCDADTTRVDFAKVYDGRTDVTIMIGPEGDFTPAEIEKALEAGFRPVTFGNTRLRTETAALYALCAAHTLISQHND